MAFVLHKMHIHKDSLNTLTPVAPGRRIQPSNTHPLDEYLTVLDQVVNSQTGCRFNVEVTRFVYIFEKHLMPMESSINTLSWRHTFVLIIIYESTPLFTKSTVDSESTVSQWEIPLMTTDQIYQFNFLWIIIKIHMQTMIRTQVIPLRNPTLYHCAAWTELEVVVYKWHVK